jgi:hypothetical protein
VDDLALVHVLERQQHVVDESLGGCRLKTALLANFVEQVFLEHLKHQENLVFLPDEFVQLDDVRMRLQ